MINNYLLFNYSSIQMQSFAKQIPNQCSIHPKQQQTSVSWIIQYLLQMMGYHCNGPVSSRTVEQPLDGQPSTILSRYHCSLSPPPHNATSPSIWACWIKLTPPNRYHLHHVNLMLNHTLLYLVQICTKLNRTSSFSMMDRSIHRFWKKVAQNVPSDQVNIFAHTLYHRKFP
jgi:hypothetical protein